MRVEAGIERREAPWARAAWIWLALSLCAGCGQVTVADEGQDAVPTEGDGSASDAGVDTADSGASDGATVADVAPDSDSVHGGGHGEDSTPADTVSADTADTADAGTPADALDDKAPKAGQALLVFDLSNAPGTAAAWRKATLNVFQSATPGPGKAYVWWAVAGDGSLSRVAVLPYEDLPYKADFSVSAPVPDDPKVQPLEGARGARVTWEDETTAVTASKPIGPVVWQGEWPSGVWVHLVHSLASKALGQPGYLQDGSMIGNYVETQRLAALAAFQSAKPLLAKAAVERAANALLGKAAAADHDGDGKVAFDAPLTMGMQGEDSPLAHGRKHIGFAAAAWPGGGVPKGHAFELGKLLIDGEVDDYAAEVKTALPKLIAFANGKVNDFKAVDLALQGLHTQLGQVLQAGIQVATLPIVSNTP